MIKIPTNLTEAIQELESQLEDQEKDQIRNMDEWEFVKLGAMFVGDKIKNFWLRPQRSPLRRYFVELEVASVDDMVDIVLRNLHQYLVKVEK